jgi:hypothetical protein
MRIGRGKNVITAWKWILRCADIVLKKEGCIIGRLALHAMQERRTAVHGSSRLEIITLNEDLCFAYPALLSQEGLHRDGQGQKLTRIEIS